MKRKLSLFLFALTCFFGAQAQVVLTENFDASFQLNATSGWTVVNNSQPVGTHSWFPGNATVFPAFNGSVSEYYAANFNSTAGTGDISNWLISPQLNVMNGAVVKFATRTSTGVTTYPDRLELRLSAAGSNTLPFGSASVGGFTNLLFSVNPQLSTSLPTSVTATSANGYPQSWTVYTATVSGVTGTVSGRLAFRYWVTGGGPGGNNSNYVGLDAFEYSLPCLPTATLSAASANTAGVCSGNSVALSASSSGTPGAISYTWSTGANSASVVVNPSATTTYTVWGETTGGCISTATVAVTVTQSPILISPSFTVCASPAPTVTLKGSGATSYTWDSTPGSSIVVSPTATTVYTLTGKGTNTVCSSVLTVTVTLGSSLSMDLTSSTPSLCSSGGSATLTAFNGAGSYSWSSGTSTAASIVVSPSITTTYTVAGLYGSIPSVCVGANTITINVYTTPTVTSLFAPSNTICSGRVFTATASGADNYIFRLGAATSTVNPFMISAPLVSSLTTMNYSVTGTTTDGCSSSFTASFAINPNPTLSINPFAPTPCVYGSVTIVASGASSYNWSGPVSANTASVNYTAGGTPTNVVAVLTGTSSVGCVSTSSITIAVSQCVGLNKNEGEALSNVYPNPFNNELFFSGVANRVEIFNALGELVLSSDVSNDVPLNTTSLTKGFYLVRLYSNGDTKIKISRLVKE